MRVQAWPNPLSEVEAQIVSFFLKRHSSKWNFGSYASTLIYYSLVSTKENSVGVYLIKTPQAVHYIQLLTSFYVLIKCLYVFSLKS